MKKKLVIILSLLVAAFCIYAGRKILQKCEKVISGYETMINSSQLLLAEQSRSFEIQRPLKVVCLGNSITKHGYLPDVEWYSDWGMAASKEENDYCHILQNKLKQYNNESSVMPFNIAHFERNPECDIDSLFGNICENADIVVIRLGENVQDVESFKKNVQRLIDKCKSYTPCILISGNFWENEDVEKVLINAAYDNRLRFIPLSWIGKMCDAYPQKGDTIYNIEGKQYVITKDFILTHPNDDGMKSIANSIFNAITCIDF
jgi:alpha-galactosidase